MGATWPPRWTTCRCPRHLCRKSRTTGARNWDLTPKDLRLPGLHGPQADQPLVNIIALSVDGHAQCNAAGEHLLLLGADRMVARRLYVTQAPLQPGGYAKKPLPPASSIARSTQPRGQRAQHGLAGKRASGEHSFVTASPVQAPRQVRPCAPRRDARRSVDFPPRRPLAEPACPHASPPVPNREQYRGRPLRHRGKPNKPGERRSDQRDERRDARPPSAGDGDRRVGHEDVLKQHVVRSGRAHAQCPASRCGADALGLHRHREVQHSRT